MLALRRSTTLLGRVATNATLVRPMPRRLNFGTFSSVMQKKQQDGKDEKPQSILSEDLLAKAGFDLDDPRDRKSVV